MMKYLKRIAAISAYIGIICALILIILVSKSRIETNILRVFLWIMVMSEGIVALYFLSFLFKEMYTCITHKHAHNENNGKGCNQQVLPDRPHP